MSHDPISPRFDCVITHYNNFWRSNNFISIFVFIQILNMAMAEMKKEDT